MKHWLAWLVLILCLLAVGTIEAHAAPPPDSAVGKHRAVKATVGYWRHIEIRGHRGKWWCYYAPSRKPNTPLPCYRVKP